MSGGITDKNSTITIDPKSININSIPPYVLPCRSRDFKPIALVVSERNKPGDREYTTLRRLSQGKNSLEGILAWGTMSYGAPVGIVTPDATLMPDFELRLLRSGQIRMVKIYENNIRN